MNWVYSDFGRRLRGARKKASLTQSELADRVGISRTSITNIERGGQRILLHTFFKIAAAVGSPPIDLLPDTTDGERESLVPEKVLAELSAADREFVRRIERQGPIRTGGNDDEG